jgi:Na+-driven multidrug efflux pump
MMLQTMGRAGPATVVAMARQFLCFLPVLFITVPLLGLPGIQLTQPLADLLAFGIAVPFTFRELRRLKKEQTD